LAVLLIVIVGGMIIAVTPLHGILSNCSHGQKPFLGGKPPGMPGMPCGTGVYRDLGPRRFENIHYGEIESFFGRNFILINRQQEKLMIIVNRKTRLPFAEDFFVGDEVVVVGDRHQDQVEAFGVSIVAD
jgi:hypothetical protein